MVKKRINLKPFGYSVKITTWRRWYMNERERDCCVDHIQFHVDAAGGRWSPANGCGHDWYKHMPIYRKMVKPEKFTHVVYVNIYVQVRCVYTWMIRRIYIGTFCYVFKTNEASPPHCSANGTKRVKIRIQVWPKAMISANDTCFDNNERGARWNMTLHYWRVRTTEKRKIECLKKQRGNIQTGTFESKRLSLPLLCVPLVLMNDRYI